nr:hypothetical protein [Tanacetum cinerariifolium]
MKYEVLNRCDDITDYEDSDQEDGELPDLFSATNAFGSVCEQATKWFKRLVAYAKYNRDSYEKPEEEEEEEEEENEAMEDDNEDDAEVINPFEEADPYNRPPPASNKETEFAALVVQIADVDNIPVPPVIQFGNFHVEESSASRDLLEGNDEVWVPGPIPCDLRSVHRGVKRNGQAFDITALDSAIVHICIWIINLGCSKHMTGNHAFSTNFVKNFLGTVRFGDNEFAVIASYGDVGLEVAFRKSTCFVRTENGVDLLTGDRSSNLYTIALNEVASNSLACLLAKASSSQSWLWHQRLSHLNFATFNNLVKNNLVQGLPKMKFEKDHLCSTCEQGKIHQKHHKSKTTFASTKPLYLLHMDLCGPMRVESINGKRYVLVVVNDYSRYTWVFFLHSKYEASEYYSAIFCYKNATTKSYCEKEESKLSRSCERKPRKGQNRIKTGQKQEACRSREKFKAVAVDKGRKTEENAKRMVENAYTVKENQEKDKIGSKPDKNEKRGEAGKSLKQLQWRGQEKLNKTQKEWPKTQAQSKAIQ